MKPYQVVDVLVEVAWYLSPVVRTSTLYYNRSVLQLLLVSVDILYDIIQDNWNP